jgi:DNA-binding MarR family transcriptional regulator
METMHKLINPVRFDSDEQESVKSLLRISNQIRKQQETILARYDINLTKLNILQILLGEFPDPLSQDQIRERITDKSIDLSRVIRQMDENTIIKCYRKKNNKRVSEILITPKGTEVLNEIDKCGNEMNKAVIRLTEEELKQMTSILKKMEGVLAETSLEVPMFSDNDKTVI